MTKEEARDKFKLADRLFNEQQYAPALKVLTELNAAFPNERHVLYPMARCLTGLGRNAEALDLADRVVRQFDYGPAVDLYKRLKAMKTGEGIGMLESGSDPVLPPGVPTLDSDPIELPPGVAKFDSGPIELPAGVQKFDSDPVKLSSEFDSLIDQPARAQAPPPPLPATDGASWQAKAFWIGLPIAGWVIMIIVSTTAGRPYFEYLVDLFKNFQEYADAGELPQAPWGPYLAVWSANSIFAYLVACWCAYWSVAAVGASPFGEFSDNMKDAAIWALIGTGLAIIPIIGWIALLVLLKRHYDLSLGKLFGVVLLFLTFDVFVSLLAGGAYWIIVLSRVA